MALTDARRRALRRKAAENALEVEHLLRVAAAGDAADAPFVRGLAAEFGWPTGGGTGTARVVPLGRWAATVCRFLEEGYAGLARLAGEGPAAAPFCVGLLEELKSAEGVLGLLAVGGPVTADPGRDVPLAARLADGFNLVLSFPGAPTLDAATEGRVRDFLHRLLVLTPTEAQRASAVCALRGVGDAGSLVVLAALPPFGGSWAGLERTAARQITKRLRSA